jgi:hypothetical protein
VHHLPDGFHKVREDVNGWLHASMALQYKLPEQLLARLQKSGKFSDVSKLQRLRLRHSFLTISLIAFVHAVLQIVLHAACGWGQNNT